MSRNDSSKSICEEVDALRTEKGIRLDVGVLYTIGTKPERSE